MVFEWKDIDFDLKIYKGFIFLLDSVEEYIGN